MSVVYARLEEGDVAQVAAIDEAAFHDRRPGDERVREELARPWTRAWVAREEGEVVGYLLSWHVLDELHVLQVATAEARRRRGIGRGLVDVVLTYAKDAGVRLVLLEVRRSNVAALALYRRVGFAEVNVRKGYYADGEDAVEMQLPLAPATPSGEGEGMLKKNE
jgi:ribosomal-protein-alanine N-acetyltransferase